MSDEKDSGEIALDKLMEGIESDPWCDPAFMREKKRKEDLSGLMKIIGVLVVWFGFWWILSLMG